MAAADARSQRRGRGPSSSKGKTSGRGHKGQRSRSGGKSYLLEGGQTPLHRRLPKRGFGRARSRRVSAVSLKTLDQRLRRAEKHAVFNSVERLKTLLKIKPKHQLKLLAGELTIPNLPLRCERASAAAINAVSLTNGSICLTTR